MEVARLDAAGEIHAIESEVLDRQFESELAGLPCLQGDSAESLEFSDRTGNGADKVAYIKLDCLDCVIIPAVGKRERNLDSLVSRVACLVQNRSRIVESREEDRHCGAGARG